MFLRAAEHPALAPLELVKGNELVSDFYSIGRPAKFQVFTYLFLLIILESRN